MRNSWLLNSLSLATESRLQRPRELQYAWWLTVGKGLTRRKAAEQRDAADEGRLEASGSIAVGNEIIVNRGKVVRPSQLIANVRRTKRGSVEEDQG